MLISSLSRCSFIMWGLVTLGLSGGERWFVSRVSLHIEAKWLTLWMAYFKLQYFKRETLNLASLKADSWSGNLHSTVLQRVGTRAGSLWHFLSGRVDRVFIYRFDLNDFDTTSPTSHPVTDSRGRRSCVWSVFLWVIFRVPPSHPPPAGVQMVQSRPEEGEW